MKLNSLKKHLPTIGIVLALVLSIAALGSAGYLMKNLATSAGTNKVLGQLTEMYNDLNAGYQGVSDRIQRVEQGQIAKPQAQSDTSRSWINDFEKNQLANLASDQYVKDHTFVEGDKVVFIPPEDRVFKVWKISLGLWDRYKTRNMYKYPPDGMWSILLSEATRPNVAGQGVLEIREESISLSASDTSISSLTNCDGYSEGHKQATAEIQSRVGTQKKVSCSDVKEFAFPATAACMFFTKGETSGKGDTAYRYDIHEADLNSGYDDPRYEFYFGKTYIIVPKSYAGWTELMTITAHEQPVYAKKDESKKLRADYLTLVNDITKNSVSSYLDEYGACY